MAIYKNYSFNKLYLYFLYKNFVVCTKATEIYAVIVLEAKSLKSRCWKGHTSPESSKEGAFLASSSFWWLLVPLGLWQCHSNFCFLPSVLNLPLLLFMTQSLDLGHTLNLG